MSQTLSKVNALFGQHLAKAKPSATATSSSGGDSGMQMVACPECHLEFTGIDLLQAHISVSHKHLDVKLPLSILEGGDQSNGASGGESDTPGVVKASRSLIGSWHTPSPDQYPYHCQVCNKGFQKTAKLTAHMKIHRSVLQRAFSHKKHILYIFLLK